MMPIMSVLVFKDVGPNDRTDELLRVFMPISTFPHSEIAFRIFGYPAMLRVIGLRKYPRFLGEHPSPLSQA
jgi:hypothetical protein